MLRLFKTTDKYFFYPSIFFIFSTLFILIFFLVFYKILPNELPLFYSLPWGSSQLIQKQQFFILPAVLLLTSLINVLLASQLHPSQTFLKRMLLLSTVITSLIILITTIKILTIFI